MSETKPEAEQPTAETPSTPTTPEAKAEVAKAEVAKAAAAVATEKLREARKAEQDKAAKKAEKQPEQPKPRRLGPLRKVHRTMLERHQAAQEPLVAELERLSKRQGEIRTQLARDSRKVHEDLVEDLGAAIAANELSHVVADEETGELYVELARRVVAR